MIVAPVSWILEKISTTLSEVTLTASEKISTLITPLVAVLFGFYIMLIVLSYWRGSNSSPVVDFMLRVLSFCVVIGIGLNQSNYASYIAPIVTGIGGDLAGVIPGIDGIHDMDRLITFYADIIEKSIEETAHLDTILKYLMVLLKSIIVLIGLMPFIVTATVTLAIAECGAHIVAMVGPLFFGALLFPATRQYFSAWVNSALSYAFLPLMVSTVSLISVGISKEALSEDGTLKNATLMSVVIASVFNWILVYLIKEAKSLASSLSSGGISSTTGNSTGDKAKDLMKKGGKEGAKIAGKAAQKAGQAAQKLLKNTIRKAG